MRRRPERINCRYGLIMINDDVSRLHLPQVLSLPCDKVL